MDAVKTGYPYELGAEDPFRMPLPVIPPCPLCSGKMSRDDPAAQALDWGVRVAEAKEGESNFWKAATAADTCQGARQSSGTSEALDEFVSRGLQVATTLEDTIALDDVHRVHMGGDILFGGNGDGGPDVVGDPGLRICCEPLEFKYPVPGSVMRVVHETIPKFAFSASAVFTPWGTCDCACCEFAQVVLKNLRTTTFGNGRKPAVASGLDPEPGKTSAEGPWVEKEDCAFVYVNKDGKAVGGYAMAPDDPDVPRLKEAGEAMGLTLRGPFCVGDRGPHPLGETNPGYEGPGSPGGFYRDACHFDYTDRPAQAAPSVPEVGEVTLTWEWESEGIIVDICPHRPNHVVAAKIFPATITAAYRDGELVSGSVRVNPGETRESDRTKFVKHNVKQSSRSY